MVKVLTKEFYELDLAKALEECQASGYAALFAPDLADAKITASKYSPLWQKWYTAASIKATGRTKQRNPVVVYAHVPNYFSDPENIRKAVEKGLTNGAGIMPQKELLRLLELEGEGVFVVDYDKLRKSESGVISVEHALEHPQTIPFLGEKERAEKYLAKHKKSYGNKIGIWYSDDLRVRGDPLGRLLFFGGSCNCSDSRLSGLNGVSTLNYSGRFFGVREASAEGAAQKFNASTLENILALADQFVPKVAREKFEKAVRKLYR